MTRKRPMRRFSILAMLAGALLCADCGRKPAETPPPDQGGEPMPMELQSHREARRVFRAWIALFGESASPADGYDLLTTASRTLLRQKWAVGSKEQFTGWFESLRSSETAPFHYRISRLDIQDLLITDARATLTASFLLRDRDKTTEEIGSFFLLKNGDSWRIPFAESGDWIASWWERGMSIQSNQAEDGTSSYRSDLLGIRIRYPRTWDLASDKRFFIPNASLQTAGLELTCTPENEIQPAIVLRITQEPSGDHGTPPLRDTLASPSLQLVGSADIPAEGLRGKLYRAIIPGRAGAILVYAATSREPSMYDRYETTIASIIQSITTLHE